MNANRGKSGRRSAIDDAIAYLSIVAGNVSMALSRNFPRCITLCHHFSSEVHYFCMVRI
jgi:hypothetical protein